MKLAFISNLYPPHLLGGYERLCAVVRDELQRRGHRVAVLTSTHGASGPPGPGEGAPSGVQRVLALTSPFDGPADHRRRTRWRVTNGNRRLARAFLAAERPDLVFVWSQLRLTLGASLAARDLGLPLAFTFNDEHPIGYAAPRVTPSPRGLARLALDGALLRDLTWAGLDLGHVTCISRSLRERLVAAGVPVSRARIIYQAVPDGGRFSPRDDPGGLHAPARVLFVGQLHAYKGVHTLIEAVARLVAAGRDLTLTVAGGGPEAYVVRLRGLAGPLGGRVRFTGPVAPADLPSLYRAHDLFVFPSQGVEAFGLTFLEAMASGLPVVASTGGGHAEALLDEGNALTFAVESPDALASALARLLDDPDLRRRLAGAGIDTVRERFTIERYVNELEAFLEDALRAPRR